jgi:hypothetical protein
MRPPLKGYLLQTLLGCGESWDFRLVEAGLAAYGLRGAHWYNTLQVALDELASAGLTERLESRLAEGRLQFRYRLTEFGRQRMADTGLLPAEAP